MDTVQKLFRFLDESPTCYHAAANAKAALTAAGAVELGNLSSGSWKRGHYMLWSGVTPLWWRSGCLRGRFTAF